MEPTAEAAGYKFDPRKPITSLAAKLLLASNAFHNTPTDGIPAAEAHTTRHAGWKWEGRR